MILGAIVACEVAFWVFVIAGLVARYPLRKPRLGAGLLIAAPVVDIVLLVLVAVDLLNGATASWHHALAAVYLGVSVAYGHRMVTWMDVRFAHRYADGPAPERLTGAAYTRKCWADAVRTAIAMLIAVGIIQALIWVVGDYDATAALAEFRPILGVIVLIDFGWAVSYIIWPKTQPVAS